MALDPSGIYYGIDGQRHGPVDLPTLRERIAAGDVTADDYVWDDDRDDWMPIRAYPDLLEDTEAGDEPIEALPDVPVAIDDLRFAGVAPRFTAWLIDVFVLMLPILLWEMTVESITGFDIDTLQFGEPGTTPQVPPGTTEFLIWFHVGAAVIRGAYWSLLESSRWQATVGKKVMGVVVTDERGHRAPLSQTFVRYVGRLLCELTFGIGYLLVLFDPRRQGLHDRVARTLVVHT